MSPTDLGSHQRKFTEMIGRLIAWTYAQPGHALTFGEAYRTPEQAALNAKSGAGIANSLHIQRLAVDFNLFIDGAWKTDTESYRSMGEFWEGLGGSWGGRFSKPDADHFSLEYNGVR